jgi:hypothetical protein
MKRNLKRKMQIAAELSSLDQKPTLKNLNEHRRGLMLAADVPLFGAGRGVFSPRRFTQPIAKTTPPQDWLRR